MLRGLPFAPGPGLASVVGRVLRLAVGLVVAGGAVACTPVKPPATAPSGPAGAPWIAKLDATHPLVGRLWSTHAKAFVSVDATMDALAGVRVVLLGERHDAPDHHRLQAAALHALAARGVRPAVALEMLDTTQQSALDAVAAQNPGDPDAVADAVAWESSGWPPFALYRPIVVEVRSHWLPLLGAGVSRTRLSAWVGKDAPPLPPELRAEHHLDTPLPFAASLDEELLAAHCGALPPPAVARMATGQRIRDSVMAHVLAGRDHAALIAGAGHVRNDRGVPWILGRIQPGTTTASLAFVEVQTAWNEPAAYAALFHATALPFDFVWFTPRLDDEDPCKPKG